jgi:hypothetical protein
LRQLPQVRLARLPAGNFPCPLDHRHSQSADHGDHSQCYEYFELRQPGSTGIAVEVRSPTFIHFDPF